MAGRVTQETTEVLYVGSPNQRVTQLVAEIARDGSPIMRATQMVLEVARDGAASMRMTQVVLEVMVASFPQDFSAGPEDTSTLPDYAYSS